MVRSRDIAWGCFAAVLGLLPLYPEFLWDVEAICGLNPVIWHCYFIYVVFFYRNSPFVDSRYFNVDNFVTCCSKEFQCSSISATNCSTLLAGSQSICDSICTRTYSRLLLLMMCPSQLFPICVRLKFSFKFLLENMTIAHEHTVDSSCFIRLQRLKSQHIVVNLYIAKWWAMSKC